MIWLNNSGEIEKSPVKNYISQVQAVGELQGLGLPMGVVGQDLAARLCPTPQPGAGRRGHGGSPSPGIPPWA